MERPVSPRRSLPGPALRAAELSPGLRYVAFPPGPTGRGVHPNLRARGAGRAELGGAPQRRRDRDRGGPRGLLRRPAGRSIESGRARAGRPVRVHAHGPPCAGYAGRDRRCASISPGSQSSARPPWRHGLPPPGPCAGPVIRSVTGPVTGPAWRRRLAPATDRPSPRPRPPCRNAAAPRMARALPEPHRLPGSFPAGPLASGRSAPYSPRPLWGHGPLTQSVECHVHSVEVTGSSPVRPTTHPASLTGGPHQGACRGLFFFASAPCVAWRVAGEVSAPLQPIFAAVARGAPPGAGPGSLAIRCFRSAAREPRPTPAGPVRPVLPPEDSAAGPGLGARGRATMGP